MNVVIDWKKGLDLFFVETVQYRIAKVVTLLLLIVLAAVLAQLTWKLVPGGDQSAAPVMTPTATPAQDPRTQRSWDIARWHLFGAAPDETRDAQVVVESLPETTLNLLLRGVVAAGVTEDSGAIIGVPNGIETFYRVGARLPGGAILREIHVDRVVLERAGRLETLRLPKELLEADGGAATATSRQQAVRATVPSRASAPARSLSEYRDIALNNPQELGDALAVTPRRDGDTVIGYEVQPGRDPTLLDQLGLVPGDVVTSINGISLDTPARAFSVLRSLSGADQLRVDIQRDGVPQSMIVEIR